MQNKKKLLFHVALLLIVVGFFVWSVIKPASYKDWILEVSPVIVGILILIFTYKKFRFTTLSYVIITVLSVLVLIGGHYIYSKVPFFNWIKDDFNFERNHYDRFGHFMKGSLVIVVREIVIRLTPIKKGFWLIGISSTILLALGTLYEIVEWLTSMITKGGKASRDFLGTQGDIWDTQWDLSLLLLGTILFYILLAKMHNRFLKKVKQ